MKLSTAIGSTLFPLLLCACSTAPRDSSGHYLYNDTQLEQNEQVLGAGSPNPPGSALPADAIVGATTAALANSLTENDGSQTSEPRIEGTCLLSSGAQEFPCAGVTLVLSDTHGNEVGRVNTRRTGQFFFLVDPHGHYSIRPLSTQYLVNPAAPSLLSAGSRIDLHLQTRQ